MESNNRARICGTIEAKPEFSHSVYGEGFYNFFALVPRLSELHDRIPVTVSERLMDINQMVPGAKIMVDGQFRSYNNYSGGGNRLMLTVFARDLTLDYENSGNPNEVYLNGFVCKPTIFRHTPFGREIADILLAVNRSYNKSDYIPLIAWGRNAKFAKTLEVSTNIVVSGRIQSREYQKKINEEEFVTKTAYEVSVSKITLCTDDKEQTDIEMPEGLDRHTTEQSDE